MCSSLLVVPQSNRSFKGTGNASSSTKPIFCPFSAFLLLFFFYRPTFFFFHQYPDSRMIFQREKNFFKYFFNFSYGRVLWFFSSIFSLLQKWNETVQYPLVVSPPSLNPPKTFHPLPILLLKVLYLFYLKSIFTLPLY